MPILLLTAKTEDTDKILGLNLGADDYMTKPFNPLEVVARVNANLRRFYQLNPASSEEPVSSVITLGELALDTEKWILRKNGTEIILTPNEYKLLAYLMQSPGRVYTKSQLCMAINGEYYDNYENAMMVHISHLREKIEEDPKAPRYIKNVRGVGYKIEKSNKRGSVFTLLLKNLYFTYADFAAVFDRFVYRFAAKNEWYCSRN